MKVSPYWYFTGNAITSVLQRQFVGLQSLVSLRLGHNKITFIGSQLLSVMPKLQHLNLNSNNISQITSDIFGPKHTLISCFLSSNHLIYIILISFQKLLQAAAVFLNGNALTFSHSLYLNCSFFQTSNCHGPLSRQCYSTNIQILELSKNRISHLESEMFCPMQNLRKLHLEKNLIKVIRPKAFMGLGSLAYLDLSSNQVYFHTCNFDW